MKLLKYNYKKKNVFLKCIFFYSYRFRIYNLVIKRYYKCAETIGKAIAREDETIIIPTF